jgi:hypothetical protein
VSGAILYLAIVAIWAVVLVPRWLRPRPAPPQPVPVPAEDVGPGWGDPANAGQDTAGTWTASAGGPDTEGEHAPGEDAGDAPAGGGPQEQEAAPSPVGRRAEVVKARRRMLTTLITLTVIAGALAVTGVDAYWIIVPPVTLLSGYLLLLRKFTQFDAERARRVARIRHTAQVRTAQEPSTSREPVPAAAGSGHEPVPGAAAAPSGAEIIDISGRIGDQVYDQYSDAANRAVGD